MDFAFTRPHRQRARGAGWRFGAPLVLWLMLALSAHAQTPPCSAPAYPGFVGSGFLGISPAAPGVDQPVLISAGRHGFQPTGLTVEVQGSTITATLSGFFLIIGLPPPNYACASSAIGPLAAGAYTVEAYVVDSSLPGEPAALIASAPLVVGATATSIPSAAPRWLLALGLMTLLAAAAALRRR